MELHIDLQKNNIKENIKRLEANGWKFVKVREHQDIYIFKSLDEKKYLHLGDTEQIIRIIDMQTTLYAKGYPVAEILKVENLGKYSYLIESSLGHETFGDLFLKGIKRQPFELFCETIKLYFEAQTKNQIPAPENYDIQKEVMAENVIQENPDLNQNLIDSALDKLQHRLQELPFVYSHGDFAARNIMDKGVIDFEFYSIAPIGLDVFNACVVENFWAFKNSSGELYTKFCYEQNHQDYLIKILSDVCSVYNLNKLLEYQNDFILFKAFWSTAYERQYAITSKHEDKWRFRRSILMYCIERYLNEEDIDTFNFQHLKRV